VPKDALARPHSIRASGDGLRYSQFAAGQALYTPIAPGGAEPTWRVGQAVNEWREITGSSPSANPPAVNPGPGSLDAIIDAWNGTAIDTRDDRIYMGPNGGHGDQYFNGVGYWAMSLNSPVLTMLVQSNTAGEITAGDTARYPTILRPASRHTYYTKKPIRARNWLAMFGVGSVASSGNPKVECEAYDITSSGNAWAAAGTIPNLPAVNNVQYVVKDEVNEDVYIMNDNLATYKWTQATNTWSGAIGGFPPVGGIDALGAYDTTRGHMFVLKGVSNASHTFNPTTLTWTARTLTGAGASALAAMAKGAGMEYWPDIDAYLVKPGLAGGGTVYRIDAGTYEVTSLSTTGGSSIPGTASISGTPENVYGRWNRSINLKGAFFLPRYTANWWFLRTH
jgi:hypothetical protein